MDTVMPDFSQAKSFKGTVHIKIKVISASPIFLMMPGLIILIIFYKLYPKKKNAKEMLYKLMPKSSLVCIILSL